MNKKILFIGNISSLSYNCVELLREKGVDVDLFVFENQLPNKPWIKTCKQGFIGWPSRIKIIFKYDIIVATAMAITYCWLFRILGKTVIAYSMGSDFRSVYFQKDFLGFLMRLGFKNSNKIIYSNPDQIERFRSEGFAPVFIPFTPSKTKFLKSKYGKKIIFFCPSRIDWSGPGSKNTNIFIEGFAEFLKTTKQQNLFELRLVEWGHDVETAKELVEKLGINNNVRFIKFLNHENLVKQYEECNVVVDQFNVGSIGTAATEAMLYGRSIFVKINESDYKESYGTIPPIFNCSTHTEVTKILQTIGSNRQIYLTTGKTAFEWSSQNHFLDKIAKLFKSLF